MVKVSVVILALAGTAIIIVLAIVMASVVVTPIILTVAIVAASLGPLVPPAVLFLLTLMILQLVTLLPLVVA